MDEAELHPDPLVQFQAWFEEAREAGVVFPETMALATASASGPSVRFVLLKRVSAQGFDFFTGYESRKARELEETGRAAAALYWQPQGRQVRLEGTVSRLPREESEAYFRSRPRGSQLAAAVSRQSAPVESRAALEAAYRALEEKLAGSPVEPPESWGGYRIEPQAIEFWEHRENRLHDRVLYTRESGAWHRRRLQP